MLVTTTKMMKIIHIDSHTIPMHCFWSSVGHLFARERVPLKKWLGMRHGPSYDQLRDDTHDGGDPWTAALWRYTVKRGRR